MIKLLHMAFFFAFTLPVFAEEVKGNNSNNNFYLFGSVGYATHDANLDDSVSSGDLSLSRSTDDKGSIVKLGAGYNISDELGVETYYGKLDGFGSTTTATATNAVVAGNTINGSLSLNEDVTSNFHGLNFVARSNLNFSNLNSLSIYGKLGVMRYSIKDEIGISGSGTVNGVSYSGSSPVLITLKKNGTVPSGSIGINYLSQNGWDISVGLEQMNKVGGGDLVKANVSIYEFSIRKNF